MTKVTTLGAFAPESSFSPSFRSPTDFDWLLGYLGALVRRRRRPQRGCCQDAVWTRSNGPKTGYRQSSTRSFFLVARGTRCRALQAIRAKVCAALDFRQVISLVFFCASDDLNSILNGASPPPQTVVITNPVSTLLFITPKSSLSTTTLLVFRDRKTSTCRSASHNACCSARVQPHFPGGCQQQMARLQQLRCSGAE